MFLTGWYIYCLLYTSDAADEARSVDLGGRRIIKKKRTQKISYQYIIANITTTIHINTVAVISGILLTSIV
ncbi:hypothetical protein PVA38_10945 [Streptococcus pneumoniae D39]|nr:hypothetical protein PVA38_10945 [Streptococcus pneumoniae D39]